MLRNVSSTLVVMIIAMLSSFAVTILLGRSLTASEFGEYSLFKQLLLIGSTLSLYGLDYSYIKTFVHSVEAQRKVHILSLVIFLLLSTLYIVFILFAYQFHFNELVFLFMSIYFGSVNLYLAAIKRTKGKFLQAQIFAGGWKIALFLLVGIAGLLKIQISVVAVYLVVSISMFIFSTYLIRYLYMTHKLEKRDIDYKKYLTYGMIFWLINSTGLISGGIDKLIIPIIYGSKILGIYSAISFVFVISLTMIGSAIGYVIFPKISAGKYIDMRKWSLLLFGVTLLISIFYFFTGEQIVSMIFLQKYDSETTIYLVMCFTLIGSLQIVHTILHFIISAQSSKSQLSVYWILTIVFIIVFIVMLYNVKVIDSSLIMNLAIITIITRVLKIIAMAAMLIAIKKQNSLTPTLNVSGRKGV